MSYQGGAGETRDSINKNTARHLVIGVKSLRVLRMCCRVEVSTFVFTDRQPCIEGIAMLIIAARAYVV